MFNFFYNLYMNFPGFINIYNHSIKFIYTCWRWIEPKEIKNKYNLIILKSDISLLILVPLILTDISTITDKIPLVLDGINTVAHKLPVVLGDINTIAHKLPVVLGDINTIVHKLPVVLDDPNNITKIPIEHKADMFQWAESFFHAMRMKSLALEILSTQSSGLQLVSGDPYVPKVIGSIVGEVKLPIIGSTWGSPLDYHWGLFKSYGLLVYLNKFKFLVLPILVPFVASMVGIMFNLISRFMSSFLLGHLNTIISNCILYLINMLEFIFYIISMLPYLGSRFFAIFIYILHLIFNYINSLMLLFKSFKIKLFNNINTINIYILNKLNLFLINLKKYLPIYSIMYIYNKPKFLKIAFIYIIRNISIRSLFLGFINIIKSIYHISLFNLNLKHLIDQYIMYINYIELCFKSGNFLPLIEYKRYMAWLNALDSNTDDIKALLKEKRDLLNLLRTLVSENLYICGHGSPYDPNKILAIQVSARARALLGLNLLEQHCLRLAAVYQELNYTEHELTIYNLCHNAVYWLKAINPNYDASEILNILNELIQVQIAKSQLIGFSHDVNEFFIISVNEDGTLEYIFF